MLRLARCDIWGRGKFWNQRRKNKPFAKKIELRYKINAVRWVNDTSDEPFSFLWICDALNIDRDATYKLIYTEPSIREYKINEIDFL